MPPPELGIQLFEAQFRIQREASEAAGRYIPMVVENVKGAQKWVGRARWHFGSYYLWGDVPTLMPFSPAKNRKGHGGSWFYAAEQRGDPREAGRYELRSEGTKNDGGSWFAIAHNKEKGRNAREQAAAAIRQMASTRGDRRKAASALIAKIPFELAAHIARCYKPESSLTATAAAHF